MAIEKAMMLPAEMKKNTNLDKNASDNRNKLAHVLVGPELG